LNCSSGSTVHTLVTQHGLVTDTWDIVHPLVVAANLTDQEQIDVLGVTCDSKLNTFTPTNLAKSANDPNAKRIDFVLTSPAVIESAEVVLTERIPLNNVNYSDHFGVSVSLRLPEERRMPNAYIAPEVFNQILDITAQYNIREQMQCNLRIGHFWFSLFSSLGTHVGIWFVIHRGVMFLCLFLSTIWMWTGVVDGLIGYVWGRWERRSLQEFASEMDLARSIYAQEGIPVPQ
jgi:sphingomyelin phosphodiesterase 2